VVRTHTI